MTIDAVDAEFANSSGPASSGVLDKRPIYGNANFVDQMDQMFGTYRPYTRAHTIEEHRKFWSIRSTGPIAESIEALADSFAERIAICLADGIDPTEAEITATLEISAEAIRRFSAPANKKARPARANGRQTAIPTSSRVQP